MNGDGLAFSPSWHRSSLRRPMIEVRRGDDGSVSLYIDAEDEEEPSTERVLAPDEARMLAAALLHFASEAEK